MASRPIGGDCVPPPHLGAGEFMAMSTARAVLRKAGQFEQSLRHHEAQLRLAEKFGGGGEVDSALRELVQVCWLASLRRFYVLHSSMLASGT